MAGIVQLVSKLRLPPKAPVLNTPTVGSPTSLIISGTAPPNDGEGISSFVIERSNDGVSGWTRVSTPTTLSLADTVLQSPTYYYRAAAVDGLSQQGAYSNIVFGATSPTAPVVNAVTINSSSASVSIVTPSTDPLSPVISYNVLYRVTGNVSYTLAANVLTTDFPYLWALGSPGTTYDIALQAVNAAGRTSIISNPSTITTSSTASTLNAPQFGGYFLSTPQGFDTDAWIAQASYSGPFVYPGFDGWESGRIRTLAQSLAAIEAGKGANNQPLSLAYFDPWVWIGTATSGDANFQRVADANAGNWWLRSSYPAGSIVTRFGLNVMNILPGGNLVAGRTFSKYMIDWAADWSMVGGANGVTYKTNTPSPNTSGFYIDDFLWKPLSSGDYQRTGVSQSASDTTVASLMRTAYVNLVNLIRSTYPGKLVYANLSQFSQAGAVTSDFLGLLDGGVLEGMIGQSFSQTNSQPFTTVLAAYQRQMTVLKPGGIGIFNHSGVTTDGRSPTAFSGTTATAWGPAWKGQRWGLCFMLTCGDAVMFRNGGPNAPTPANYSSNQCGTLYFDEDSLNPTTGIPYSKANAKLGVGYLGPWIDPPQTAPFQNGCYRRRATFGEVWMNPYDNVDTTVTYGRTVRHISGTQDTAYNNGASVTSDTLTAGDGRIVLY